MPSPGWIRIVIGLAAAAMVSVALLAGKADALGLLRWVGILTGVVTLVLLVFDRWAWRWPGLQVLSEASGSRVLHGTWRGTFEYADDGDGAPGAGPLYLAVNQTYSQLSIRGYFPRSGSTSISLLAALVAEGHRHLLRYVYQHEALAPDRDRNRPTQGVCELAVVGRPVEELCGSYYSERGGKGTIRLSGYCARVAGSAAQAQRLSYRELASGH